MGVPPFTPYKEDHTMVASDAPDGKPPTTEQEQPGTAKPRPAPLFALGKICATTGALYLVARYNTCPGELLSRHVTGDWGDIHPEDIGLNELAILNDERIFSVYKLAPNAVVWIITEADRRRTTLLQPSEY